MKTSALAAALLCLTMAAPALADVAPEPLHEGLSPKTRAPTEVIMKSERVDVGLGGRDRCDFALEFVLHNPADAAETLEVGFPTSYEGELKDLTVTVDGASVKVEYEHEVDTYKQGPPGNEYSKTSHTHWLTWKMTFPAGATRRVAMRYWVVPRDNSNWRTRYRDLRAGIEDDFPKMEDVPPAVKAVHRGVISINTGYTLVTGAGWAGRIGEAVISVSHPTKGAAILRSFHPRENYTLTDKALTWTFTDFEPTFDLDIEYTTGRTIDEEIVAVDAALKATDRRLGLLLLLDHLLTLKHDDARRITTLGEIIDLAEKRTYRAFYSNALYRAYPTLVGLLDHTSPEAAAALRVRATKHLEGLLEGTKAWNKEKIMETLERIKTKAR